MNFPRQIRFPAYRAAPFALFALYDFGLLRSDWPTADTPYWIGFVVFWGGWALVPAAILLIGGHYVRKLEPRSEFSLPAVLFSSLLSVIGPLVVACWGLGLRGGRCT